jgi:hypothetical protein
MHEVDRSTCIEAAHSDRATARSGPRVAQSCRASLSIVRHSSARSRRGGRGTTRRASRRARPRRPSSAASSPRPRPSRVIATDLTSPSPSPASPLPRHRLTMIRRPPRPRHGHATTRSSQPPSSSPHHLVEHGGREQHDGRPEAGRVALLAGLLELDARVRKGVRRAVAHRRAQPEQACRRPRRASGHHRADAPRAREERRSGRGGGRRRRRFSMLGSGRMLRAARWRGGLWRALWRSSCLLFIYTAVRFPHPVLCFALRHRPTPPSAIPSLNFLA